MWLLKSFHISPERPKATERFDLLFRDFRGNLFLLHVPWRSFWISWFLSTEGWFQLGKSPLAKVNGDIHGWWLSGWFFCGREDCNQKVWDRNQLSTNTIFLRTVSPAFCALISLWKTYMVLIKYYPSCWCESQGYGHSAELPAIVSFHFHFISLETSVPFLFPSKSHKDSTCCFYMIQTSCQFVQV